MGILNIPGLNAPRTSDLAVMHSFNERYTAPDGRVGFAQFLAGFPPWALFLPILAMATYYPVAAYAQSVSQTDSPFAVLLRWMPLFLFQGFSLNILISFMTMMIGTLAGVFLGLGQISSSGFVRRISRLVTRTFQNSPWLVVIFVVMLSLPNRITVFGEVMNLPDWIKAVLGLSLPIMANVSEILRGAIQSVPSGQWEAAESLAYTRRQTLWFVILPQCIKRMIPPWMNWYAILTMATPLVSILGVGEVVNTARMAMAAENDRPDLIFPFFGFVLIIFFAYCYPIARLTMRLERRFTVKQ
nr:amino acid ABC transporter permease [uncultured Roseovarius sp.]